MKKIAMIFFVIPVLIFCFLITSYAADETQELFRQSGTAQAFDVLDEETIELFREVGVDIADATALLHITPGRVILSVIGIFTGKLNETIKKCAVILGAVILLSVIDNAAPSVGKSGETGGMIVMLMLSFMVIAPVSQCIANVLSAVKLISVFMKLLIPVMTGFVAASGKPLMSAASSACVLGACEAVSAGVDGFFVPVTGAYAAVCIVAAVNPMFNLQNIALFFRKIFTVVLGGMAGIFSGILSLKSSVASTADNLFFKGAKFLIGGLVPVVGGAISEGLNSVTAAFESVNHIIGSLGILAIVFVVLPPVTEVLIWWAALYFCSLAATLTGQSQIAFYLSGVSNVIVMLNILLLFDAFVFIAATGIIMRVGM